MIKVRNVSKSFDGFRALDNLSFSVPWGAVYGLVGPNGSGKSTIIRHLTGIYKQDDGEITIDDKPVFENDAIKSKIACVPDDIFYFGSSSTEEMMRFYKGVYPRFSMERYKRLHEVFPLDDKAGIRRFSKGQQKQVAFRLALSMRPDLLILDEPVDGLDPVMRRQVWSLLMGDVSEYGTTVLVSSHNLRELEDVCDHIGILSEGRLLLERGLSDLQTSVAKFQIAFNEDREIKTEKLDILHASKVGKIHTLIIRDSEGNAQEILEREAPLFVERIPLGLEEIFIYELGGEEYAVKEIIL
ncbi:ABC transporter ATP-binding protein [Clostridiaceae bacterium OttesenSCG-928-D20]|nr:ABC transporter ATP-binding protein [Clostridiaceae bacterium OttesenSCG-928-D20]